MLVAELTEQSTSRYVQAGKIRVHYNEAGTGEAVVFCEGQGPGTSAWAVHHRVIEPLSKNFRCLLLDQPGYGKSDTVTVKGESRSTMYARTVRDFLDALKIEKASIVDMSFGGQTGQIFAIDNPERVNRLVLHASGMPGPLLFGSMPGDGILAMNEAFENPTLQTMRKMMNAFLFDGPAYSDEELMLKERLDAWLARPDQDEARRNSDRAQRDILQDLDKIKCPVLQIHGRHDRVVPVESALKMFNYLPNSRIVILSRCGHWAPIEKPEEFTWLVTGFLGGAMAARGVGETSRAA